MSDIDIIKELRDSTGLSVKDIKKALEEAKSDKARAIEILKAHGATIAEKKSQRSTNQGIIESYIHSTKKVGVLVELLCESDFVSLNPLFIELAHELAMHVAAMDPSDLKELYAQPYIKDQDQTVEQFIQGYIAKLGENIKIGKFSRLQI
jgi:elongation factor Ts